MIKRTPDISPTLFFLFVFQDSELRELLETRW